MRRSETSGDAPGGTPEGGEGLRQRIESLLASGAFPEQSRLPNERQLAEMLGTTRWPLRKALSLLEADGRIWRHVGRGTFVGQRPARDLPGLRLTIEHTRPTELIEARELIEPGLAAAAAVRATSAQIGELRAIARKCATARNMEEYEQWDEALHRAIADASGSALLRALFDALNAIRKEIIWGRMRKTVLRPDRRAFYSSQHDAIIEAIAGRDAAAARAAMLDHMQSLEVVYFKAEQHGSAGVSL